MGQINVKRNANKEGSQALKIPRIEIELGSVQSSLSTLQSDLTSAKATIEQAANLLGGVIRVNAHVVTQSFVLASGYSGVVVGPIRLPLGVRAKINEGARLVIL